MPEGFESFNEMTKDLGQVEEVSSLCGFEGAGGTKSTEHLELKRVWRRKSGGSSIADPTSKERAAAKGSKPCLVSGDNSLRDPPVPIPNTEVKPQHADSTWLETAR